MKSQRKPRPTTGQRCKAAISALRLLIALLLVAGSASAQGNIFGQVENSDATTPAATDILWWGFLDDTDEEIRIESSIGAGYDGANWFDDFQNYTTEAAGNPYDYYFYNLINSESFHLAKPIPDNSFQQEDIVLSPAANPAQPTGLSGNAVSPTEIVVRWNKVPGVTYHVYRRNTSNNGLFNRIDDPAGSLSNPGVADSLLVDATSDGVTNYTYLIIAEDGAGNYSPHSAEISIAADHWCDCGVWGDVNDDGSINPVDVVFMVNHVYMGWDYRVQPPNCPFEAGDTNCDGAVNPVDVVLYVNHVYLANPNLWCADPCGE